jgi:hypothetical protein
MKYTTSWHFLVFQFFGKEAKKLTETGGFGGERVLEEKVH